MSLLTSLTYVLPHRFLSSLARRLAYSTSPGTKQWLIDTVTRSMSCRCVSIRPQSMLSPNSAMTRAPCTATAASAPRASVKPLKNGGSAM